jgi:hypothetical protein
MNSQFELLEFLLTLFNTCLGLTNLSKNTEQENTQKRIEQKLDLLLGMIDDERNKQ